MPNNLHNYPFIVFRGALILLIAAMPWSRAIISISTALLFASALAEIFINKILLPKDKYFFCLSALVIFFLIDIFRAESIAEWFSYFSIKLPLLVFSFSVLVFKSKITPKFLQLFSITYCIAIASATLASTINYLLNYTELNALVLQSKPIPIIGGIHHITFSVFCAFAVILSAHLAFIQKIKWLWIFTIINLIGLHILAARTGLAGFYFACSILGLVYILNTKPKVRYLIAALSAICLLPVIAFYSLSSFHNRVLNTKEDMKVIWYQKDANYQSMGMRIEASKTAFALAKKHPITGVGCSNIKQAMSMQYELNNTNLFIENRILPHNQFVIEAAIHGITGLFILLLFFAFPLFNNFTNLPTLFIALWSLTLFACMFECLFDRQHGVILISLLWFIYLNTKPIEIKNF